MIPTRTRARYSWVRTVLAALGFTLLVAGGGLREDELECEQAVAKLQGCCPDYADAQIECHHSTICGLTEPALSIAESQCIAQLSCEEIVARDLCARTKDLESPHDDADGGFVSHPPVCP
jgi:hypothetical protein